MALLSAGRKLSYEILSRTNSNEDDDAGNFHRSNGHVSATSHKKRRKKKKPSAAVEHSSIPESPASNGGGDTPELNFSQTVLCHVDTEVIGDPSSFGAAELRQRTVNAAETTPSGGNLDADVDKGDVERTSPVAKTNGKVVPRLQTAESLDWQRVMADDPNYMFTVDKSPLKYFMEEMSNGNSLRSTTTLGNEKERERVYDTIFRLPWRCELLINVGFFVCFDSFLSLLTIMPTRILMTLWRLARTRRQFNRRSLQLSCLILDVLR